MAGLTAQDRQDLADAAPAPLRLAERLALH